MSVAISPFDGSGLAAEVLSGAHGVAQIRYQQSQGRTRLGHLYQSDPLRVLFPREAGEEIPGAALVTTSGGMVGGDRLDVEVVLDDQCRARVTTQAAEKVYRSRGGACSTVEVRLQVGADAWLEWVPQETIFFDRARCRRRVRVDLRPAGRVLAGEMLVFGRQAHGESVRHGLLREVWEVHRGGRLVWADALHLQDDVGASLAAAAQFDGARACATLVYGADNSIEHLEAARALMVRHDRVRCAATLVNGLLVARWLSPDPACLRKHYAHFFGQFRHHVAGLPARLPRLWHL